MSAFKEFEGMTLEGSAIEERHEIWKLLFEKNLIYGQCKDIETESLCLRDLSFYMLEGNEGFVPDNFPNWGSVVNIPFEEFKTRLSQL